MKKIILSYDYELFFGDESGTVQKTLIEPTNILLDCFLNCGIKVNFFIDYLMIKYLRQQDDSVAKNDLILIEKQIQRMVREGHRVELHIHSHWVDAKYKGEGHWDYSNFSHYSLSTFPIGEIKEMFKEGCEIIEGIARKVEANYKIAAFRAGGWAIQPFDLYLEAFVDSSIQIDSSSASGVFSDNPYSSFDFRDAPNKSFYRFSKDICMEDPTGTFIEVPIATYKRSYLHKILDHSYGVIHKGSMKKIADGTHVRKSDYNTGKSKICKNAMFTIAQRSWITILLNILSTKNDLVTFIDHPKDFTPVALRNIKFLSRHFSVIQYVDLI